MTGGHPADPIPEGRPAEFADYRGDLLPSAPQFRWHRLLDAPSLRGLAVLLGATAFLLSNRSTRSLALVLGAVVVVFAVSEATVSVKGGRRRFLTAAMLLGLGIALFVWPEVTGRAVSRLLGSALLFLGVRDAVNAWRDRTGERSRAWLAIRGTFTIAVGVALWLVPGVMLSLVIALFAGFWVITGASTVAANLTGRGDPVGLIDTWPRIFAWLENRPHTADDRGQLYAKLFYEGDVAARRLSRFFLLMGFATTIAAFGIVSDSTAVVIGAMLVAPLMTPLMGTSLAMIMGWPRRATVSVVVAVGGIGLTIALSAIYGGMVPYGVDPVTNSQVASRITPNMIDLYIAIAAGAAGAFALSRPDVSDALPGVAVAIALVPPLAVVGLMIEGGRWSEALGAFMLFITNAVAILLVGALVFLLTGVVPMRLILTDRGWVRNMVTLIGIMGVVVLVVLGSASRQLSVDAFDRDNVERAVGMWVGDQDLTVTTIDVGVGDVEVVVVGPDSPEGVDRLADLIESDLGRDIELTVRWVPEERFVVDDRPE